MELLISLLNFEKFKVRSTFYCRHRFKRKSSIYICNNKSLELRLAKIYILALKKKLTSLAVYQFLLILLYANITHCFYSYSVWYVLRKKKYISRCKIPDSLLL